MKILDNVRYFVKEKYEDLSELTMNNIKIHYLDILEIIPQDKWEEIYIKIIESKNMYQLLMFLLVTHIHLQMVQQYS